MSVFISYAWEGESHRRRVEEIVQWLKDAGHEVCWDDDLLPGTDIVAFMERGLQSSKTAIAICTENYKQRADARETQPSGVGYEAQVMAASRLMPFDPLRVIPMLLSGSIETSLPGYLKGIYCVNYLEDTPEARMKVLKAVFNASGTKQSSSATGAATARWVPSAPLLPIGDARPTNVPQSSAHSRLDFEPIHILRLVVDEVTEPSNDGTKGSALYSIPFELSARAPAEWASLFVSAWRNPPQSSLMHRPRSVRVEGTRLILDRTMIDEVEKYHVETLRLCLDVTNAKYSEHLEATERQRKEQAEAAETRRRELEEAAKRLRFD